MWNNGHWKTMVPPHAHRNMRNVDDFIDFLIKEELYREKFYPIKKGQSRKEHKEFIRNKAIEDFIINSQDTYGTEFGNTIMISPIVKWLNQFTDIEIGNRGYAHNQHLQAFISKSIYSILGDGAVPTQANRGALKIQFF